MPYNPKSKENLIYPRQPSGVDKDRKEIRLPKVLIATLEANAKIHKMTFSAYVEKLLVQALEE